MNKVKQIQQLEQIATLLFDSSLTNLRLAAKARAETEALLAGLVTAQVTEGELPQIAADLVALNYQRWVDRRRAELNQTLARQTAAWIDARDAAQLAFGKTQALAGVAAKVAATASVGR